MKAFSHRSLAFILVLSFAVTGCGKTLKTVTAKGTADQGDPLDPGATPDPDAGPTPIPLKTIKGGEISSVGGVNLKSNGGYKLSGGTASTHSSIKSKTTGGYKVFLSVAGQGVQPASQPTQSE